MVSYSFEYRFAAPILAGATPRRSAPTGSAPPRLGERVQLFTGMRLGSSRRLREAPCLSAQPIRIELPRAGAVPEVVICKLTGALARYLTGPRELARFARADGFADFDDLHAFWAAEHPGVDTFHGVLIQRRPLVAADAFELAGEA